MHPRIQEVLNCLDRELEELRAAVETVPLERRRERPAPGRWSVAEVLEHLAKVERSVMKACERQIAATREAGLPRETETSSVLPLLPLERIANRDRVIVAPDRLHPLGMDPIAAWADIERTRARFNEFIRGCDGIALAQMAFAHPVLGPLNLYQWLLFAAGHHARHAAQVREIGEQLQRAHATARPSSVDAESTSHADQKSGATSQVR
jgi:hypothetical protein